MPVIGRISVGRTHSRFSTNCKIPLSLWDSRKQRIIGKSAIVVSVNKKLGECTALIHARFHELSEGEESFTAIDVRDVYQGQIHRQTLLLESFREYYTDKRAHKKSSIVRFQGIWIEEDTTKKYTGLNKKEVTTLT